MIQLGSRLPAALGSPALQVSDEQSRKEGHQRQ